MKSELEKRIMRRVFLISLYKNIRNRVPLKVLMLTIILSLSTKMISYKTIYGYFSEIKVEDIFSYVTTTVSNAPIFKIIILMAIVWLIISVVRDIFKVTKQKKIIVGL